MKTIFRISTTKDPMPRTELHKFLTAELKTMGDVGIYSVTDTSSARVNFITSSINSRVDDVVSMIRNFLLYQLVVPDNGELLFVMSDEPDPDLIADCIIAENKSNHDSIFDISVTDKGELVTKSLLVFAVGENTIKLW